MKNKNVIIQAQILSMYTKKKTNFYQNPSICLKNIEQNAILNIHVNQGP